MDAYTELVNSIQQNPEQGIDELLNSLPNNWQEIYSPETPSVLHEVFTSDTNAIYQKIAILRYIKRDNFMCVGPGGTGKSYVISIIKRLCKSDTCLFLAPTGMAALNMDSELGRTIHSLFKNGEKSLLAWNWEKCKKSILKNKHLIKELLDSINTIILDEFSMIISGLLNTLINMFSIIYYNDSRNPFSGRQVILCGDPLQLPAVKNLEEALIYEGNYINRMLEEDDYIVNNPYFRTLFCRDNILHFNHNFRSTDPLFNLLLFNARSGFNLCNDETTEQCIKLLNTRRRHGDCINPESPLFDSEFYNTLYQDGLKSTLKNEIVDGYNCKEIDKLILINPHFTYERELLLSISEFREMFPLMPNPDVIYDAICRYMDSLNGYKTDFTAVVGERVMLRVNNLHPKLKNGSLGTITEISENDYEVKVNFDGVGELKVRRHIWSHPEYSCFQVKAFPLIPAWAITIHKLQGQSISSNMFILLNGCDMKSFPHLLYTAISRMTDINNLFIIYNGVIVKEHFPVSEIMYKWYITNTQN